LNLGNHGNVWVAVVVDIAGRNGCRRQTGAVELDRIGEGGRTQLARRDLGASGQHEQPSNYRVEQSKPSFFSQFSMEQRHVQFLCGLAAPCGATG